MRAVGREDLAATRRSWVLFSVNGCTAGLPKTCHWGSVRTPGTGHELAPARPAATPPRAAPAT